jgi:hypothetical protein
MKFVVDIELQNPLAWTTQQHYDEALLIDSADTIAGVLSGSAPETARLPNQDHKIGDMIALIRKQTSRTTPMPKPT